MYRKNGTEKNELQLSVIKYCAGKETSPSFSNELIYLTKTDAWISEAEIGERAYVIAPKHNY